MSLLYIYLSFLKIIFQCFNEFDLYLFEFSQNKHVGSIENICQIWAPLLKEKYHFIFSRSYIYKHKILAKYHT